jgi:hypothetical protein
MERTRSSSRSASLPLVALAFVFAASAGAALGCAGSAPSGLAPSAGVNDSGAPTAPSGPDASVVVAPSPDSDAALPPPRVVNEVFGHSASTLYRLDPQTKAVAVVGNFVGCGNGVIDIALDKDSNLFGTTYDGLVRIDRANARCTSIASGSYPNSLSFVPAGTLDPASEVLVGYQGGTYVRIDTQTGAIRTVGSLGGGYQSSGDIVSVIGGKTYLTVNGNGCADCLVEVNPSTGALVKNWGTVDHPSVYGLAFWGGTVFGFNSQGRLFSVDFNTSSLRITPIAIPNAPSGLSFFGAGSATSVPLEAPR